MLTRVQKPAAILNTQYKVVLVLVHVQQLSSFQFCDIGHTHHIVLCKNVFCKYLFCCLRSIKISRIMVGGVVHWI